MRRNLFGYACALCADTASAEDLYQDAVVRAMSAANPPREPLRYRLWMFRLLRNLWIDRLRRERRLDELMADPVLGMQEETAITGGEDCVVNRLAVRQAFMLLSKAHRDVLALVDIGGFSYDETAELLELPRGTVMSRISRARAAMARHLAEAPVVALPLRRGRLT
ncbi:MAG: RNA polymerase sigma factor [Pararhodobacter sp.]